MDVVILTDKRYAGQPSSTGSVAGYVDNLLLEDRLVADALLELGLDVDRRAWCDASMDWNRTRSAVFRTTWDYFDRWNEFSPWLENTARQTRLFNAPALVRWNLDKHYLQDLEQTGVVVVPTTYVDQGKHVPLSQAAEAHGWSKVVIKPAIAGGAVDTYLVNLQDDAHVLSPQPSNQEHRETLWHNLVAKQDMLVQPFLTNVVRAGEVSLVWIDGKSHTAFEAGQIEISGSKTTTEEPSISSMWTPKWHRWPKTSWTGAFPCAQNEIGSLHLCPCGCDAWRKRRMDVVGIGDGGTRTLVSILSGSSTHLGQGHQRAAGRLNNPSRDPITLEMDIAFAPCYVLDVPEGHRFPMQKYSLLRDQIVHEGLATASDFFEPKAMPEETILLAHDAEYWRRTLHGEWSKQEIRRSGFPWSHPWSNAKGSSCKAPWIALCGPCPRDRGDEHCRRHHHAFADPQKASASSTTLPWRHDT